MPETEMMYFIGGVNNEHTLEVEKDLDRIAFPTVRQAFGHRRVSEHRSQRPTTGQRRPLV